MEALKTKDKIEFYTNLKTTKNSAKRVTVAQQECHLAQLSGAPASGSARFLETSNTQPFVKEVAADVRRLKFEFTIYD
jgi:hypothetical protein